MAQTAQGAPLPLAPPQDSRPVFQSLYRTDGAPISHVVQELWTTRPRVAAALMAAPGTADAPTQQTTGSPLSLFQDQPTNARGLFGGK